MFTFEEHLNNLVRHIQLVHEACLLLGRRLIARGETDFGRLLIAKGFQHDKSKFYGIEWRFLHQGKDTPRPELNRAIQQHIETNDHHPEYWGGIQHMPRMAVAEMVCDWYARSQELGTALRSWITLEAVQKFGIDLKGDQYVWIQDFVSVLLEDPFVRE